MRSRLLHRLLPGVLLALTSGPVCLGAPPPVVLLYHEDADVRTKTIESLAAGNDPALIDDLIRAQSVENYTPVHITYQKVLSRLAGQRLPPSETNWKAWLASEVEAGRLKIDYLPVDPAEAGPSERAGLQPLASQLGPDRFAAMAERLRSPSGATPDGNALRYMVANDHLPQVQHFLAGDWLVETLGRKDVNINLLAYCLNGLAEPGPLRDKINTRVIACLQSGQDATVTAALQMIAGVEGFTTVFRVPGAEPYVRGLLESKNQEIARAARRAMTRITPEDFAHDASYAEAFRDLYDTLGRRYPCFALKGIDWGAVGEELLPKVKTITTNEQFGMLCLQLVARLEDSHAALLPAKAQLPRPPFPQWDPGFACLLDNRDRPVVFYLDRAGPAEKAGVAIGMTVTKVDGRPVVEVMEAWNKRATRYAGFSSQRYLNYQAARMFCRQLAHGQVVELEFEQLSGESLTCRLPCTLPVRYLPRLPVPIAKISDSANVSWTMLDDQIGYLHVRRIASDLIPRLDQAVAELHEAGGLIVDVRGNSGGGFDAVRAHRNFATDDSEEPNRPRFLGPVALLLDSRCISAAEGWASWFIARKRATSFGETTAGASSGKETYLLKNGLYRVQFPVKAYTGFLDRPIERRGLEPDVPLRQTAADLAEGRDTVLEAARKDLRQRLAQTN